MSLDTNVIKKASYKKIIIHKVINVFKYNHKTKLYCF